MVLAFFGRDVSEAGIAELLGTDDSGTEFASIAKIETRGVRVEMTIPGHYTGLRLALGQQRPVIVGLKPGGLLPSYPAGNYAHAVVVVGVTAELVCFHDPDRDLAPIEVSAASFQQA